MLTKIAIIKKLPNGKYRLYSRKKDKNGKRRNLGTYDSLAAVKKREKAVQYFKHHAKDGATEDHQTKTLGRLSNIATFLEEAGFIDASDKVYDAMDCIDPGFKTDYMLDFNCNRVDNQVNTDGGYGTVDGRIGGGFGGWGGDVAEVAGSLVNISNHLDKIGAYEEADEIDDLLRIIEEVESIQKKKESEDTKQSEKEEDKEEKQGDEVAARSNGRGVNTEVDSPGCGGLSDAYFYRSYPNFEGAYGPSDR
jgi:hypothetical protein